MELESMIDDFVTFFIAGQETTANTLSFCFMELARNPKVYQKLKEEINQVIGSKATITFEDLSNLEYTNNVFKETLRLWPNVPNINRIAKEGGVIEGYKIPEYTEISVNCVYLVDVKFFLANLGIFSSIQLMLLVVMRNILKIQMNLGRRDSK